MTLIRRSEITVLPDGTTAEPGVYVTVKANDGTLAALYNDDGSPLSNPVLTGAGGAFAYNVAVEGQYTEEFRTSPSGSPRKNASIFLADLGAVTLAASSRAVMSALNSASGLPALLGEHPRQSGRYHFTSAEYLAAFGRTLAADMAFDNGSIFTATATGAWAFPYWAEDVSVRLFGAVDGTDVKAAIEAWSTFVWNVPCKSASCLPIGTHILSVVLNPGRTTFCQTTKLLFAPKLNALAAMDLQVQFRYFRNHVDWGDCRLYGSAMTVAGEPYATRLAFHGIQFTDCQNMTSTGKIRCFNHKCWNAFVNDGGGPNSNHAQLPKIIGQYGGLGKGSAGHTMTGVAWDTITRIGGSGAIGQTWTIKVASIPTLSSLSVDYSSWVAWIGGNPYSVLSCAASGDPTKPYTLTFGNPWLDDTTQAAGSGTLDYTIGGALLVKGSDSNNIRVPQVHGFAVGTCFRDDAFYGAWVDNLVDDGSCAIWYGYGSETNNARIGGGVRGGYIEGTARLADIINFGATAVQSRSIGQVGGASLSFAKIFKHGARASGVGFGHYYQLMTGLTLGGYEGRAIVAGYGPTFTVAMPDIAAGATGTATVTVPAALGFGYPLRTSLNKSATGGRISAEVTANSVSTSTVTVTVENKGGSTLSGATATVTLLAA